MYFISKPVKSPFVWTIRDWPRCTTFMVLYMQFKQLCSWWRKCLSGRRKSTRQTETRYIIMKFIIAMFNFRTVIFMDWTGTLIRREGTNLRHVVRGSWRRIPKIHFDVIVLNCIMQIRPLSLKTCKIWSTHCWTKTLWCFNKWNIFSTFL